MAIHQLDSRCTTRRSSLLALSLILSCCFAAIGCAARQSAPGSNPDEREWIQLFNGHDLNDWQAKFTGYPLDHNLHATFRVVDGVLQVNYDGWNEFNGEFGHLFYNRPFSYYLLVTEYRFVGEQVAGGPDWARRNNGIMVHSQSAQSMGRDQDFPVSIEVQLLGGLGEGERSTGNLCTPGTHVVMDGELITAHCINSSSRTFDGDQWVRVEVLVLGDSLVQHIVDGDTVLQYTAPQMGGGGASNLEPGVLREGEPLREGYIALQAESAPTEFRRVELLNLAGCTDPQALNWKSYFVRSDPTTCRYADSASR